MASLTREEKMHVCMDMEASAAFPMEGGVKACVCGCGKALMCKRKKRLWLSSRGEYGTHVCVWMW